MAQAARSTQEEFASADTDTMAEKFSSLVNVLPWEELDQVWKAISRLAASIMRNNGQRSDRGKDEETIVDEFFPQVEEEAVEDVTTIPQEHVRNCNKSLSKRRSMQSGIRIQRFSSLHSSRHHGRARSFPRSAYRTLRQNRMSWTSLRHGTLRKSVELGRTYHRSARSRSWIRLCLTTKESQK